MISSISKGELNRLGWFHINDIKDKIKKIFRDNVQDGNVRDGCMDYYDLDIEEKILELLESENI